MENNINKMDSECLCLNCTVDSIEELRIMSLYLFEIISEKVSLYGDLALKDPEVLKMSKILGEICKMIKIASPISPSKGSANVGDMVSYSEIIYHLDHLGEPVVDRVNKKTVVLSDNFQATTNENNKVSIFSAVGQAIFNKPCGSIIDVEGTNGYSAYISIAELFQDDNVYFTDKPQKTKIDK